MKGHFESLVHRVNRICIYMHACICMYTILYIIYSFLFKQDPKDVPKKEEEPKKERTDEEKKKEDGKENVQEF